ncbi:hypothetical protein ACQUQU_06670 [Thalassolituus sp. LLYu03]|uniref:hypothetical protein n=1 Tax=Thalassolituus sp. LLYu03 TaxID=3421656 RepID=UPI003D2D724D
MWMDAEGRIHNSPKPPSVTANEKPAGQNAEGQPAASELVPELEGEAFPDEQDVQEALEQDKVNRPPFYTWVDEAGIVRNQFIPTVSEAEEQISSVRAFDLILVPPLRVSDEVRESGCCAVYSGFFVKADEELKSFALKGWKNMPPFKTMRGDKPAWYWALKSDNKGARSLQLRLRGVSESVSLIGLDGQFKPLYFEPVLPMQSISESWSATAYHEALINIDDPDFAGFILYFPQGASEQASVEVQWWH